MWCRRCLRFLLWSHAEKEPYDIEASNEQFVQSHDQSKGNHGDDQKLRQDAHIQGDNEPTDAQDDRLVEQVEGQHCLVAVGQHLVIEIKVFCAQAQHKDDRAPTGDAPNNLKEHVQQRKRLVPWRWVVVQYQCEESYRAKKANKPQGQAEPAISLNTVGKTFIGHEDVAYDKEGGIPQEIGPASSTA